MENNTLKVIKETEILGETIKMYGSIENPLFLASDVAKWIEYSKANGKYKVSQMIKVCDENEKGIYIVATLGGNQEKWFVTEDGLYEVCMQSRKPIAKQMKKEIKAYLKQIRLTGGYIPIAEEDDDSLIMAKAIKIADATIKQKDILISELLPKVDTYDRVMATDGTFSMNHIAKQVGMGEYHLFAYLRGKKVLFYEDKDNVPYERFRKNGCFKVVDTVAPNGESHAKTRVTQKGLDYICKLLKKDEAIA